MANLAWPVIIIGCLLTIPAFLALLLRSAGCPGWSVLGGLLAGLLLGPQILGALLPPMYEQRVIGGLEQHLALNYLESQHGADLLAAKHAGVDAKDIGEMQVRHAVEVNSSKSALESAQWNHQRFIRIAVIVIVALVLLGSGLQGVSQGNLHASLPAAISIGLWSGTLPAALIIAAMVWWWDHPLSLALVVAAAMAIGPWTLTAIDRAAANEVEINGAYLIQTAGRIASIIAMALAAVGAFLHAGIIGLVALIPLLALPLGWLIPKLFTKTDDRKPNSEFAISIVLIPALAACVAFKADLFFDFAIWPLLVILLLSDDGRWIAAFIGAMIPGGRRALRTMRLTLGSMAAGPTQLAVTAIGAHFDLIPTSIVLPLMLGTALIEVTAPARRGMAQRLSDTEEEWDQIDLG